VVQDGRIRELPDPAAVRLSRKVYEDIAPARRLRRAARISDRRAAHLIAARAKRLDEMPSDEPGRT